MLLAAAALFALAGCTPSAQPVAADITIGTVQTHLEGDVEIAPSGVVTLSLDGMAPITLTLPIEAAAPVSPLAAPAPPAAAAPAACDDIDFSSYVGRPYDAVALLDAQVGKIPQSSSNYTFNAAEDTIYWTGAYVGGLPEGISAKLVDGKTGLFCVRAGTVATVNFVGAMLPVSQFDPNVEVLVDEGLATGCMPTELWIKAYQAHKNDTSAFVLWADAQTNVEGAPFLAARMRPNPLGPAEYTGYKPVTLVFWTRAGSIGGVEATDYVVLSQGDGMAVYLIATDRAVLTHAHTGVQLCSDLNPVRDLGW